MLLSLAPSLGDGTINILTPPGPGPPNPFLLLPLLGAVTHQVLSIPPTVHLILVPPFRNCPFRRGSVLAPVTLMTKEPARLYCLTSLPTLVPKVTLSDYPGILSI